MIMLKKTLVDVEWKQMDLSPVFWSVDIKMTLVFDFIFFSLSTDPRNIV